MNKYIFPWVYCFVPLRETLLKSLAVEKAHMILYEHIVYAETLTCAPDVHPFCLEVPFLRKRFSIKHRHNVEVNGKRCWACVYHSHHSDSSLPKTSSLETLQRFRSLAAVSTFSCCSAAFKSWQNGLFSRLSWNLSELFGLSSESCSSSSVWRIGV